MSKRQIEDANELSDDEIHKLFGLLAMHSRRSVVNSLMVGNDSQCFSTQQYLDTYVRDINNGNPWLMDLERARKHLKSLKEVRVVKSDLWTVMWEEK